MTDTTAHPTVTRDSDRARIAQLERLATTMDSAFRIPGTRLRIGFDSLLGLLPGVGDTLTLLPTAYIVGTAWQMGVPKSTLGRMVFNSAVDWGIGTIPLIGDIFDVGFKANLKNVALLKSHVENAKGRPAGRPSEFV